MAKKLKILVVCGFGVGTSLMLKMNIEKVLKPEGIAADVVTGDIGSAPSTPCDIVFTSTELGDKLKSKMSVPVVVVKNFVKPDEIQNQGLEEIKKLLEKA